MEIAAVTVSFVLTKLDREDALFSELKVNVEEMKSELGHIRSFIKKVEAATTEELDQLKVWVEDVREVAYDIEDFLDDYTLPRNSVRHLSKRLVWAHRIEDIMKRLQGIKDRRDRYAVSHERGSSSSLHPTSARSSDPRDAALDLRGDEIVGIEDGMKELTEFLKVSYDGKLKLISVVGMAGIGKTTLVKQVYDSEEVEARFETKAWITVSRSCGTDELLRCIIQEFQPSSESLQSMTGMQLRGKLDDLLRGKRYVIVLDDIWNIEVLSYIKNAFPCSGVGSRIMVTTCLLNVKSFGDVYQVEPLPPQEAWELFKEKAFSPDLKGKSFPQGLDNVAWEIVNKCGGLPLLIVEVGSQLNRKGINLIEWKKVLASFALELSSDPCLSRVLRILTISYSGLNHYLRSCFIHLGIFPEGQLIKRMRLIRLWIAEGFVEENAHITLEEVADGYLNQLVYYNVIQVAEWSDHGRVKSYKVHPFMHQFILQKSREQNFCLSSTRTNVENTGKIRRLSIHGNDHVNDDLHKKPLPRISSFFSFGINASVTSFFKCFEYLRVLDLENAPLETLPKSLKKLIHLRYLSLENTRIKVIPKKLSRLVKLEVLNLKGTFVCQLPSQILSLKRIRHLLVYRMYGDRRGFNCMQATTLPEGIGQLTALQKLSFVDANGNSGIIRELGNLRQLRRLGLVGLRREHGLEMCKSIVNMKDLRSFSVKAATEEEHLDLYRIQPETAPPDLERVYLRGRLRKLPEWILSLQSLARLTLGWSGLNLKEDPFNILRELPSLAELTLLEAYTGEELYCGHCGNGKEKGFPNLKSLHLDGLHHLQIFFVINGAMPFLQKMHIRNCEHLRILPPCIGHLTALEELNFSNMPGEFVNDIRRRKERGEIVTHIGSIRDCGSGMYI